MEKEFHNHMRIPWHDYTRKSIGRPITEASLSEKASIIGRTGIMLLSCGTGAWRVRSSMNTLARELGNTCTADIGLLSIEYTCIDCGICLSECPQEAITTEDDADAKWIEFNAEKSKVWPNAND